MISLKPRLYCLLCVFTDGKVFNEPHLSSEAALFLRESAAYFGGRLMSKGEVHAYLDAGGTASHVNTAGWARWI